MPHKVGILKVRTPGLCSQFCHDSPRALSRSLHLPGPPYPLKERAWAAIQGPTSSPTLSFVLSMIQGLPQATASRDSWRQAMITVHGLGWHQSPRHWIKGPAALKTNKQTPWDMSVVQSYYSPLTVTMYFLMTDEIQQAVYWLPSFPHAQHPEQLFQHFKNL